MTKLPDKTRDRIKEWVAFAKEDLEAAKVLFEESIYNQSCFHSQQCAEKILKALLLLKNKPPPKIHDLNELFERCTQAGHLSLLQFSDKIATLSLYYAPTRYPDAMVGSLPDRLPTKADAKEALEIAELIFNII